MQKKIEVYPHLKPCAKINSKYVKYFSLRPQTIKLLDEKFRFCSLTSVFPIFLKNLTTKAQITKTKNKQVGLHSTKDFCIVKKQNKTKQNYQQNEKVTYELVENMCKFYI